VDPLVYNMSMEDPGGASFAGIGGLGDQIRELREVSSIEAGEQTKGTDWASWKQVIELPLMNPELFMRVGIKPPKGSLDLHARSPSTLLKSSFPTRCPPLWPSRNRQDTACPSRRCDPFDQLPQGRLIGYRRQVHWRERTIDS
jgi:hypothetical protein